MTANERVTRLLSGLGEICLRETNKAVLGRTVSEGQGGATISDAIQTDALINPGNSGGALVDLQGNLVGIPTLTAIDPEFKTPANGVGFAISSSRSRPISHQMPWRRYLHRWGWCCHRKKL